MTTMLETLRETSEAYTSETRAIASVGSVNCQYLTDDGRMCAIGRCMLHPEDFTDTESIRDIYERADDDADEIMKPEYRGYPLEFWDELQDLHDTSANWDHWGLSPAGRKQARDIAAEFPIS